MRTGDLAYLRSFMVFITVEVLGADRCTPRCHPGSPGRPQDTRNVVCTPAERSGIRGLFAVKVTCEYHRLALAEDMLQHKDLGRTFELPVFQTQVGSNHQRQGCISKCRT